MISMWTFLKGNTFCCSLVIDKLICQIWFNISTWRSDIYILKLYSIKYCEIIKMYLTLEGMWALEVSGDSLASRETSARTYSSMHCMHKRKVNSIYKCTCTSNEYVYRWSATLGPLDCMRMQLQDLCKRPYPYSTHLEVGPGARSDDGIISYDILVLIMIALRCYHMSYSTPSHQCDNLGIKNNFQ